MPSVCIFNPDHDYALASGRRFYTPPVSVISLAESMAALPLKWADPGDTLALLLPLSERRCAELQGQCSAAGVELALLANLGPESWERAVSVKPWGWNLSLRQALSASGCPDRLLPDEPLLDRWRNLAHRRTTVEFNRLCNAKALPLEIKSAEEAMDFYRLHPDCWFKAPWSSSGRGVLSCHDLQEKHVYPWLKGTIRRQGSVMAERNICRVLDCASEWEVTGGGNVRFMGLSLFQVSPRGKYKGNHILSQPSVRQRIEACTGSPITHTLHLQSEAIKTLIAPYYTGLLGIDMAVDNCGCIWPCIEINLRRTMGHISLD